MDKESMFTELCEETHFKFDALKKQGSQTNVIYEAVNENEDDQLFFDNSRQLKRKTESMKMARSNLLNQLAFPSDLKRIEETEQEQYSNQSPTRPGFLQSIMESPANIDRFDKFEESEWELGQEQASLYNSVHRKLSDLPEIILSSV